MLIIMTTTLDHAQAGPPAPGGRPAAGGTPVGGPADIRPMYEHVFLYIFVIAPFLGVIAGIVLAARGNAISWLDVGLAVVFFAFAGHGITIGFHRYFTHGSFKAKRPLRIGLAVAGSMAVQGPIIRWVADHRRHHAFSDRAGDPHSPWRFGPGVRSLAKGLWWAHLGWLFDRERTPKQHYAKDLMADRDIVRIHKLFPVWTVATMLLPAGLGWALSGFTWHGAWTALLWAGLVRVFLLHHVTWSINSVCHVFGSRPFSTRDKSTNFWPLAVLSMGESWHNLHHADPTCARHGVDRGQIDSSAALIRLFETAGWARDVRWPNRARLDGKRAGAVAAAD
jgi:stearoyl-CoA desaturase (Delta-9 desaturase)